MSRRCATLPLPPRPVEPTDSDPERVTLHRAAALDYFSITLSHPRWLAARWLDRVGFDAAEAWMQFNNTPGSLTLRANRLRITREELAAQLEADDIHVHPSPFAPDGLIVDE